MVSQFHKLVLPLHGYSYDISKAARATGRGKSFINHINPDSGFSPFISFCPEYLPGTETKVHFRKLGILILHLPYRVLRSVASAKTSLSSAPVTEPKTRGFPALMQHGDNPVRIRSLPFRILCGRHLNERVTTVPF